MDRTHRRYRAGMVLAFLGYAVPKDGFTRASLLENCFLQAQSWLEK